MAHSSGERDDSRLVRLIKHPWTMFTTGIAALVQGFGLADPFGMAVGLIHVLGATAGTWFPLLGVLNAIGGLVEVIPKAAMQTLFIVGAVIYALFLSDKLIDRIRNISKKEKKP
jgi:hypothetical protein